MTEQIDKLIELLENADALQQSIVGNIDDLLSYNIHNQLVNIIDTIEELKNETD